ncbi:hypothetical protein Scep_025272 [Stephania cephalantha]|uniref:HAT C-terminal dimerisation domain-containing protein n=1 Tax=Stephania cephalantha TaxID=152367 RepID=A0AAP0EQA0_9MAGN
MSSNEFRCNSLKCQLELYLDEPKMPRHVKLDILDFWKSNQFRYPNLASMARDILSIRCLSSLEASFSLWGRVLDQYRSSLKRRMRSNYLLARLDMCGIRRARCQIWIWRVLQKMYLT